MPGVPAGPVGARRAARGPLPPRVLGRDGQPAQLRRSVSVLLLDVTEAGLRPAGPEMAVGGCGCGCVCNFKRSSVGLFPK